ncbi:MAG: YggS family pyridoxal phosphate enzyme [Acidimicrobiales bacterium]
MAPSGAEGSFDAAAGLVRVRARIAAAGGDPDKVRVVAVTKGFGRKAVDAARDAGIVDVGENYAQELLAKDEALRAHGARDPAVRWHFLGAIQRNKIAALAPVVACWQSVARVVEGEAIARRRPGAAVLVEVDTTGAAGRNGCAPEGVPALVAGLRAARLEVEGLMTVAPLDPDAARAAFRLVRSLADDLGLAERSMGMSDDLELAVAEGSTMVRVGRALFGDRPARRAHAT